jgi:hypothetical protein
MKEFTEEMGEFLDGVAEIAQMKIPHTVHNYKFFDRLLHGDLVHSTHGELKVGVCTDGCCLNMGAMHNSDQAAANIVTLMGGEAMGDEYAQAVGFNEMVTGMD